jgi:hypothetical protein
MKITIQLTLTSDEVQALLKSRDRRPLAAGAVFIDQLRTFASPEQQTVFAQVAQDLTDAEPAFEKLKLALEGL